MNRPKHLLIDLDGTLLGSRDLPLRIGFIVGVMKEIRKHEPRAGFFRCLRALRAMRLALEEEGGRAGSSNEIRAAESFGRALGIAPDRARGVLNDVVKATFPKLKAHFFPIPEARNFLGWAKARYQVHLATNPVWPREVVELRLSWAGIDPRDFEFVAHAGIMHACKPSLEYYHELLMQLKAQASDCLMIGDSERKDLPAAQVGIPVYLLGKDGDFSALRALLEEAK